MKTPAFRTVAVITALIAGFFFAGLFRQSDRDEQESLIAIYEETRQTVEALRERNTVLEATYSDLLKQSSSLMAVVDDPGERSDLITSWREMAILAGLKAVEGEGVIVRLDDRENYDPLVDPVESLIHDGTINHVLTLLVNSGARALSVNDIRLTPVAQIYCIGPTILCYHERLVPPYDISAIGPAGAMAEAIEQDALLERLSGSSIGVRVEVIMPGNVRLPSYAERGDYMQLMTLLKEEK
jgi:uncharacterized protein YlxW (UPF0749 family)